MAISRHSNTEGTHHPDRGISTFSPQSSITARKAWAELQEYVVTRHNKRNRLVILAGDLNASKCDTLHRKHTDSPQHVAQGRLLSTLMESTGLTDTFPHCHPDKEYRTWNNHETWSSTDHIMYWTHVAHDIMAAQTSDFNVQLLGTDHRALSAYIQMGAPVIIPKQDRDKIKFDVKRKEEYATALDEALEATVLDGTPEELNTAPIRIKLGS